VTAVIDVPSDKVKDGIDPAFRISDEHMKDVKATIDFMQTKNLPVFLAGQSLGTISVAMAGINYSSSLDGIIMTSNATKPRERWFTKWPVYKKYPNAILDFELDEITVPDLVVAHAEDSCEPTPPDRAKTLQEKLVNSPNAELKTYTGGQAKETGCNYWGHHSYYGQEEQVVNDISAFIKANL
jgi:pimeloyl-ACP methyl ester carboxylesterase